MADGCDARRELRRVDVALETSDPNPARLRVPGFTRAGLPRVGGSMSLLLSTGGAEQARRFPAVNEPCNGPIPLSKLWFAANPYPLASAVSARAHRLEFGRLEFRPASGASICAERRRFTFEKSAWATTTEVEQLASAATIATHERRDARRHDHRAVPGRASRAGDQARRARLARAAVRRKKSAARTSRSSSRVGVTAREPRGGRGRRPGWPSRRPPRSRRARPTRRVPGAGGGAHARELRRGGRRAPAQAACSWSSTRRGARSARSWSPCGAPAEAARGANRRRSRA